MELHAQLACRLPDKVEIIDAGPMAELVYYRACLRCREYLTDGVIARAHLTRWFAGIPQPTKHLERLVAVGLLLLHPTGWQFPEHVWRKWIPSRSEVDAKRATEAERIRAFRERKRTARESNGESTAEVRDVYDRTDDGRTRSVRGAYEQPEPEPEPEPIKESARSLRDGDERMGRMLLGTFRTVDQAAGQ